MGVKYEGDGIIVGHMMLNHVNHDRMRSSWNECATSRKYHVQSNADLNNTKQRGETAAGFLPIFPVAVVRVRPATQNVIFYPS